MGRKNLCDIHPGQTVFQCKRCVEDEIAQLKEKADCFARVWSYLESEHEDVADEIQAVWLSGDIELFQTKGNESPQ